MRRRVYHLGGSDIQDYTGDEKDISFKLRSSRHLYSLECLGLSSVDPPSCRVQACTYTCIWCVQLHARVCMCAFEAVPSVGWFT